jgi:predicted acylesterase/phospholipase RssA
LTRRADGEIVNGPSVSEEREHSKLGLALSGGGHRAAFFHIGVLAKLAELGLLRPVQVISTVSGGSIIGALYYLHVKNLLESKTDAEIRDADYVELVGAVEHEYREAAASNVRGSGWANLLENFKMAKSGASTRRPGVTGRSATAGSRCATC